MVWVVGNSAELGIDPNRFMIAGASAGGGLAAGTALRARDSGLSVLSHQMLLCPMLDDRFATHSSRMLDGVGVWDRNDNLFGWDSLLGARRAGPDVSAYAATSRADDPSGLPRTFVDVGSAEGFRDEAEYYARRLSQAGVSVDLHVHAGGFHGYEGFAPHCVVSQLTETLREHFVRRAFED